jgi:periplasmic protein TonB
MHALGYVAGVVGSFLLHVLVAFAVLGFPGQKRDAPSLPIEFEVREPPKPPPAPPPAPEPEPPKHAPAPSAVRQAPKEAPTPQPPRPTAAPAPVTAAPIFGVDMTQTSGEGTIAVPVGDTTIANPKARRPDKPAPVAVAPPPPPPPKKEITIKDLPEILSHPSTDGYPSECREAERQGVEGTVRLSVMVLESGQVGEVKLVKGVDPCLDAAALRMAKQIKFKPAMTSEGRAAAYRIRDYRFRFKINR